jgi:2-oxoisovalerate dehydrogenase E2 component (dihydrolipoyl transacylase)
MATPAVKKLAKTLKVDLTKITGTGANGRISKSDVESAASSGSETSSSTVAETSGKSEKVLATPKIRGYAKSKNVDLSEVVGTGPDGRISQADVDAFLSTPAPAAAAAPATPAFAPMVSAAPAAMELKPVDLSGLSAPVVKKLTPIQKAMVSSMNMANQVPHFGYSEEYNMNALVEVRAALKEQTLKETGVKISYMPFIIKALSLALHEFPMLNASLNKEQNEVTYHPRHNIGFATDTPHGLLVPNIKDCQSRSILEIASELNRLHQVGLQNKLKPEDLTGGTFSLSNIGAIGGK